MTEVSTQKRRNPAAFADARAAWARSRETCEQLAHHTLSFLKQAVVVGQQLERVIKLKDGPALSEDVEQLSKESVELFWKATANAINTDIWLRREIVFLVTEALPEIIIDNQEEWATKVKDSFLRIPEDSPDKDSIRARWESLITVLQDGYDEIGAALRRVRPHWDLSFFDSDDGENEELELSHFKKLLDSLESEFELRLKERERIGAGRPAEWNRETLEREVRRAAMVIRQRTYRAAKLRELAEEISKRRPLTESALKMLMKRHGLSWRQMKATDKK